VIDKQLPEITGFARTYLAVDPYTEPIPIQPTCHYAMGGIPTDADAQVLADHKGNLIEGFYAAGECACVSVHGANRLGTNSLLDIIVFGRRGGKTIRGYLEQADWAPLPADAADRTRKRVEQLRTGNGKESAAKLRRELQETMMEHCGVFRDAAKLAHARERIAELKDRAENLSVRDASTAFNTDMIEAFELECLLGCADAIAIGAENRAESRGAHCREDHPGRSDEDWLKHTILTYDPGGKHPIAYKSVNLKLWKEDGDEAHFKPKPRTY
jgi:succinate dehydrogenase / fumarate reductase flavoprotein subunit